MCYVRSAILTDLSRPPDHFSVEFKEWVSLKYDMTQEVSRYIGTPDYCMFLHFQGVYELV